jgi:hypothetical protein
MGRGLLNPIGQTSTPRDRGLACIGFVTPPPGTFERQAQLASFQVRLTRRVPTTSIQSKIGAMMSHSIPPMPRGPVTLAA